MADERLGASFSIDITQLQAGLRTANKLIRESQSEFKAAAAGLDDWRKSEEGLTARNQALTQQMQIQQTKVDALKQNYQNLINQGLDPTSDRAIQLRTQINNEEAALRKCQTEIDQNTEAMQDLGDETEEAGKDAEKSSEGFTVLKGVLANLATDAVHAVIDGFKKMGSALVQVGKQAIESYADYEQLVGGVETLFGAGGQTLEEYAKSVGKSVKDAEKEYNNLMTAQNNMIENANNAYKTAGMSANEYMSNVTGFSASLISSLDGDTVKAAAAADRAMIDISDNANKMGTDMQSIVDTYQSLARGNYQMLDNLKLGYGGTKEEMERMIADANAVKKANGEMANLSVDSFADVTEAIHIIQNEMGITGTTSKEASTTIQGSIGMMKSSWQNLLTGMADETMNFDQLITNFIDSIEAVAQNLIPRITVVLDGIVKLIEGLLPQIPPLLVEFLPQLVNGVVDLINGLVAQLPAILDTILDVIPLFINSLIETLPTIISALMSMITSTITALSEMLPTIVDAIIQVVPLLITSLLDNLPALLQAAITLLMAIVEAIPTIVNALYGAMPDIINTIVSVLINNLPMIINGAVQLFMGIVEAIPKMLPTLISYMPKVIKAIFDALTSPNAINSLKQAGSDLIKGLWNGISDMASWIGEKIRGFGSGILDSLKSFFGIASPSRLMSDVVGKNIVLGIIDGIDKKKENAKKSAKELSELYLSAAKSKVSDLKALDKMTVADEVAFWEEYLKHVKKGNHSYTQAKIELLNAKKALAQQEEQAEKEAAAKEEAIQQRRITNTNERLEMLKLLNKYTVDKEVEMWKKVMNETEKGSDAYMTAYKNYLKARNTLAQQNAEEKEKQRQKEEEAEKSFVENTKTQLEKLKKQNKITVADEIQKWREVLKTTKSGSEAYKTAQKELLNAQKEYHDKSIQYEKDYKNGVASIQKQLKKDIKSVVAEYDNAVESRKKSLLGQFNLFEAAPELTLERDPKGLIKNLDSQVEALKEYNTVLNMIEERGVPKGLMEELRGMGVDDLDQLNSVNDMTDEELKKYIKLWKERNRLAKEQATHENEDLLSATQEKIAKLTEKAQTSVDNLKKKYVKNLASLGVTVETKSIEIGSNIVAGIESGVKSKNKEFQTYLKNFFASITNQAQESLKIHSPSLVMKDLIGKNIALGIVEGFDENIKGLRASISGINDDLTQSVNFGSNKTGIGGRTIVVNQTNNYSQAHSRYELYKSKQQTAAAVRLAIGTV